MTRKTLIIIAVILAVILAAGVVFVVHMSGPNADSDAAGLPDTQTDPTTVTAAPGQTGGESAGNSQQETQGDQQEPANTQGQENQYPVDPEDIQVDESQPTQSTEPTSTEPLIPNAPEASAPAEDEITYLDYHAMSGEEQAAFINTFSSYEEFFAWYNAAEKAYKDGMIEIDNDTTIDLGDLSGGN